MRVVGSVANSNMLTDSANSITGIGPTWEEPYRSRRWVPTASAWLRRSIWISALRITWPLLVSYMTQGIGF